MILVGWKSSGVFELNSLLKANLENYSKLKKKKYTSVSYENNFAYDERAFTVRPTFLRSQLTCASRR